MGVYLSPRLLTPIQRYGRWMVGRSVSPRSFTKAGLPSPRITFTFAVDKPQLRAIVGGTIRADNFVVSVRWTKPGPLPRFFRLNAGYTRVYVNGVRVHRNRSADTLLGPIDGLSSKVRDRRVIDVSFEGIPSPPAVHLSEVDIEVDYTSEWLPVPHPFEPTSWEVDLFTKPSMVQSIAISQSGVTLIALSNANVRTGGPLPRAFGRCDASMLELAAYLVYRGVKLWRQFLPALPETHAEVVLVDRPKSQFCYTRPALIRIPQYILAKGRTAQILHEAGHLWWGNRVAFSQGAHWLSEALAEYGLLLAEEIGILLGYKELTRRNVSIMSADLNQPTSLSALNSASGKVSAYVLRAKGALALADLRADLGDTLFRQLLSSICKAGTAAPVTTASFFERLKTINVEAYQRFESRWFQGSL